MCEDIHLEEWCKDDGKLTRDFMVAVETKGTKLYTDSCIGWIKIPKSGFYPMNNVKYLVTN